MGFTNRYAKEAVEAAKAKGLEVMGSFTRGTQLSTTSFVTFEWPVIQGDTCEWISDARWAALHASLPKAEFLDY